MSGVARFRLKNIFFSSFFKVSSMPKVGPELGSRRSRVSRSTHWASPEPPRRLFCQAARSTQHSFQGSSHYSPRRPVSLRAVHTHYALFFHAPARGHRLGTVSATIQTLRCRDLCEHWLSALWGTDPGVAVLRGQLTLALRVLCILISEFEPCI